jgi:geranylgeranyl diphosphate synthase type I
MTLVAGTDPRDFLAGLAAGHSRGLIRDELGSRWPETADELLTIVRYALLPAGKLLRPVLALASAEVSGGRLEDLLPAALGLEYLHAATLVHDDIIDGDDLRRGRASVPAAFGVPAALVVGDYLIFAAFDAITRCCPPVQPDWVVDATRALAGAGTDMCRGQALEDEFVGRADVQVGRYLEMTRLKTGALFRAVCEVGALLSGAGGAAARRLARYGEQLGIAFQIRDDLLAYTTPDHLAGKRGTSDLANRRPTLAVLLAYQAAAPDGKRRLAAALSTGSAGKENLSEVAALVRGTGAVEGSREHLRARIGRAQECLAGLESSPGRATLASVARWAAEATV